MDVPQHHFTDEVLLDYSAGNAQEALGLPVACHLDLCADCRDRVNDLEIVTAASLTSYLKHAGHDPVRERLLAGLPARELVSATAAAPVLEPSLAGLGLPAPLHRYLAAGTNPHLTWRMLVPGVREIRLRLSQHGASARLVRLKPGVEIPHHDHEGPEYTVVFRGGLQEGDAQFLRGDVCVRDRGLKHTQRVHSLDECVALVVNHGQLVPLSLKGHLLKLIAGI
jgi:putative transcriptional regulator